MRSSLPVAVVLLAIPGSTLADVTLHDFEDISLWRPNPDGGHAPEFTQDHELAHHGAAMRIRYSNRPPDWGNLTGPCHVPPDARALRLWVYKVSAQPRAALHIWLFEPDGDGWVQQVRFEGQSLGEAQASWHEARLPVSAFRFEPRGNRTRQMTTVNRMLIGCNFGNLEVTVDSMTWEIGPGGAILPLPITASRAVERGQHGSVGILDLGEGLPDNYTTAHPPEALAEAVRAPGFGATILKAGDLADPDYLTPQRFDVVILPYGPYFPAAARHAFLAYLKAGGSFLSTDGYAFDRLVLLTDAGWSVSGPERTAAEMDAEAPETGPEPMNTRLGQAGDALTLKPEQIGVFDPQFPLEHATRLRLAENYARSADLAQGFWRDEMDLRHPAPTYEFQHPVSGFSASGLIGVNGPVFPDVFRRWVPVLEALDTRGNLRGTALSILHNYAGEYAGSSWAFTGLTDGTDLFLGDPARRDLLARVLRDITEKVFLHELATDLACYEPGETAVISVRISNFGRATARRMLRLSVGDGAILEQEVEIAPGETRTVEARQPVDPWVGRYDGLIPVEAVLGQGPRMADCMDTAFCIRDERVLASGPKLAWEGNFLTVDGRPTFLVGSNQTGMMFYSAHENPAVWDRDFRNMAEHNFHLLRILHFSPFSRGGYEGRPTNQPLDLADRPLRLIRQMDAIVQLAQRHRVAIFLSLHDWMGVELTDQELQAQADWNRFWAQRYRDVPGIIYDVQNEPSVGTPDRPDIVALWNRFLEHRYGSDEALRQAWHHSPPEAPLPNVPLRPTSNDWDDVRSADRKRFESELLNRWVKANVDGLRAGDPDALVCVGYLPWMAPADKMLGVRHTDFSNMHYYGSTEGFPAEFALIDRRFEGKGLSLGECGAQEAHDARTHGMFIVPVAESIRRFQTYLHYGAGLGAAFLCNWDWKDFDESVFPWGLIHHGSPVAKPWLHTWEQGSLLLSLAEPAYHSPLVFILAPDRHRTGPHFDELHNALKRCVELTLDQRVDFAMINEEAVEASGIPQSAQAILWPLPYCPTDETFRRVLDWVRAGGTLYLSGDVSFDPARLPTRSSRFTDLGLPLITPTPPFHVPGSVWQQAPVVSSVGEGRVLFVPYPLELQPHPNDADVYRQFVDLAGVARTPLEPADAPVRALRTGTRHGGRLIALMRTGGQEALLTATLPDHGVSVDLSPSGQAFVLVGPEGVRAVESQGEIRIAGRSLARGDQHYGLAALDGRNLAESRQVLILPHQGAQVTVTGLDHLAGGGCWIGTLGELLSVEGQKRPWESFTGTLTFNPVGTGLVGILAAQEETGQALARVRDQLTLRFARRTAPGE